jgi:hypothetical protein
VEAIGAFDVFDGQDICERPRGEQKRTILPAAEAPVGTDERFERGDVEGDVFNAAVDVEIGGLRPHDRAREHPGGMVAVRQNRILAHHFVGVEAHPTIGAERPRHTRGVHAGDEADALVSAKAGKEIGPALLEIIQR